ncbi:MAG: hypothetical protein Q8Q09_07525 [Deltaproteobacteria bacterium]|nr:hypothetical protein [Deltaproteobacteria bacterium]
MSLYPCNSCGRHVKHSDSVCPFCHSALTPSRDTDVTLPRMSRAALVMGAALAMGGCDKPEPHPIPQGQTQPTVTPPERPQDMVVHPVYGAPPPPEMPTLQDASAEPEDATGPDVRPPATRRPDPRSISRQIARPAYGGPPPRDPLDHGGGAAAYGAPPGGF